MEIEIESAVLRDLEGRLDRSGIVVKGALDVRGRMEERLGRGRGARGQRADRRARPDRREDAVHEVLARLEKIDLPRGDGAEAEARRLAAQPPASLRPLAPDRRRERYECVLPAAKPRENPLVVGEDVNILGERIERRAEREVRVEPPPRDETAELAVALARPGEERDAPEERSPGALVRVTRAARDSPGASSAPVSSTPWIGRMPASSHALWNGTTAYIPSVSVRARAGIPAAAAARARSSTGRVPASMEKFEWTRR